MGNAVPIEITETIYAANVKRLGEIPELGKFVAKDRSGNAVRCRKALAGDVFVYAKGRSRYGWHKPGEVFLRSYIIPEQKSEEKEWKKRLNRAIVCMSQSGLWPEIRETFRNLLSVSYDDWQEMRNIHHNRWDASGNHVTEDEMDERYAHFAEKYPFAFTRTADGHLQIETNYIYEISECKLKSMYFGKRMNAIVKENFARAIRNRTQYSVAERTSYDVSLSYDPEKQKAWYSEEYKDCGNGHYYLALNHSTALFCEDD